MLIKYKLMSFDIECYSKNQNSKRPDASIEENVVFSIACTFCIDGVKNSRNKVLLTLFDPNEQPPELIDEIRRYSNERS